MKISVTGALGHIGSLLIRELPAVFPGAEIVMLDNLSTQRYCSLFELPAEGRYRFVEADLMTADLNAVFAGSDVVIHLAAITDAAGSFAIRDQVERVNLHGTRRVAESCSRTGSPLIFPSTTSVYGSQRDVVDEECAPHELRPQSPYAESKLKAERFLQEMGASAGLRFVTCRFGTIFGVSPGMRFHTAINKFCWQAAMGQPLTVWRTAMDQHRPYLNVADAARALVFIVKSALYDGGVYNVLTTNSSVRQIVDIITTWVPEASVEYVESEIMNQLSYTVSDARFRGRGFQAQGRLEDGIVSTIRLLRNAHRR